MFLSGGITEGSRGADLGANTPRLPSETSLMESVRVSFSCAATWKNGAANLSARPPEPQLGRQRSSGTNSLRAALTLSQACQTNPGMPSFNARYCGYRKSIDAPPPHLKSVPLFCLSLQRCLVTRRPCSDTRGPHSSEPGSLLGGCFL